MNDHMDEALDLFKRVWNRKDLDAETQIEQVRAALSDAYERGRQEERERCAKIAEDAAPVSQDMEYAPLQELSTQIAEAIRKDQP